MQALLYWQKSVLFRLEVSGHAPAGQQELCSAVSCLLRSSAAAVDNLRLDAASWTLELLGEGSFRWQFYCLPEEVLGYLQGVSSMLACGLRRLARDFAALELVEQGTQVGQTGGA